MKSDGSVALKLSRNRLVSFLGSVKSYLLFASCRSICLLQPYEISILLMVSSGNLSKRGKLPLLISARKRALKK
jgi:hypothetical protein